MKTAITMAALCLLCGPVFGGPHSYSEATPPSPPVIDWTGFYLGASGGYTRGQAEPKLTLGGAFDQVALLKNALEERGSKNFDYDGGQAGGLIGYNYQFGNCVVGGSCRELSLVAGIH